MKFFQKNELRLLWPFYLEQLIANLFYILIPFEILYLSSIGLSATQIGILIAVLPLASLLFEIPTGSIADLYGRKLSVILGFFLMGTLFLILPSSSNYYFLITIFALLGVSFTFISGSYNAWAIDLIKHNKKDKLVKSYFPNKNIITNIALIFAGLLGVFFVSKFGLSSIWYVSGIAYFIGGFILLFGKEHYEKEKIHVKESLKKISNQTKTSIHYAYKHHTLYYLILISILFSLFLTMNSFISLTYLLKEFKFPDTSFGYLFTGMSIIGIIGSLTAKKFIKKYKEKPLLIFASIVILIYTITILFAYHLAILISLILILNLLKDFQMPVYNIYFHEFIPSKMRSTIGSVQSMLCSIMFIIAPVLTGFLIDNLGARYTIALSGIAILPIIFFYFKIKEEK